MFSDTVGITPADAGKTVVQLKELERTEDHPRGCGENVLPAAFDFARQGSPPRMRGKLALLNPELVCAGITPADAGKTLIVPNTMCCHGDHPRGCGENQVLQKLMAYIRGSPPRMRGKQRCG